MSKRINWNTRAIYVIVALVMTLGLLLVPTAGSVLAQVSPGLFALQPSLALNVKGAVEKYEITYAGVHGVPAGVDITQWSVTWAWMTTLGTIVDGGQPGDDWISVQAAEPGEAHIAVYLDINGDGVVDKILDAEKKWGEINCTELTSASQRRNEYVAAELVKATFIWGAPGNETRVLPADDAVLHWWLMDIGALAEIQAAEAALGTDPCDADGGCGKWTWQANVTPLLQVNDPLNKINNAQAAHPVNHSTAYLYDGSLGTAIDPNKDYAESMTGEDGKAQIGVYAASANTVLLVTLAEYPLDYHGENRECIQHETFKPVIPSAEVKTPQLRWAGEKIVLEKDWSDLIAGDYSDYVAEYNLEFESVGTLHPALASDYGYSEGKVFARLDENGVSQCILESEQSGEADVDVALYPRYILDLVEAGALEDLQVEPAIRGELGFLVYFLEFEDVTLAESITPASTLAGVSSDKPVDVAVNVTGFFDYRHSKLMATNRPEKLLDLNGDFKADVILPAGRYVFPDDWWILAGTQDASLRPNWDMMDMANNDKIDSTNELGPYDSGVVTTDPPAKAEYPTIGPFSTLQSWSSGLKWITQATVPSSLPTNYVRNTVVPDGKLNWYDAPMPQALVTFRVTKADSIVNHTLSGLDKGNLSGYGYTGTPKVYHSPYYEVEIPASPLIPAGYDWDSWGGQGPYPFWTDLKIKSNTGDTEPGTVNTQDVDVYSDNHGIAAVTVGALGAQGSLQITATADYPYAPKRGKYGPRVSSPITIGSRTDLNPHFVVDKIAVAVGETVTFDPRSTQGGSLPYTKISWDFDNDGTPDLVKTGSWTPATLPVATWHYNTEGKYYPCLEITDSSAPSPVVRTECMTDPYSITVGAGVTKINWNLPYGLDADAAAVNIYTYPTSGVAVTLANVDTTMPAGLLIWYYGGPTQGWKFYKKGWGATNTLISLVPGESYISIVPTASVWGIPQG